MRASIIIAAHNEGQSLWKTVRSCIESIGKLDYEILIADDASDDESVEEALRRFPQLSVHRHGQRQRASPTKHLGASNARGEVLVFLDGHCNPEPGAIHRLVEDVERLDGQSLVTPTILALDTVRWKNKESQVGHGYRLELDTFNCGWLPLASLRKVRRAGREFYESPAAIGCAFAVHRELYDDLRGFDPHMRIWGVEDLDFSLKCWLMGNSIVHDPEARIGHRFRDKFDNYDVPVECILVNKLRMAYKNFTQAVWSEWVERCRQTHSGRLPEHPEGLWACAWNLFNADMASAKEERTYLLARRQYDEISYAARFALQWPKLDVTVRLGPRQSAGAQAQPSPAASSPPPPCERCTVCSSALIWRTDKATDKPIELDKQFVLPKGRTVGPHVSASMRWRDKISALITAQKLNPDDFEGMPEGRTGYFSDYGEYLMIHKDGKVGVFTWHFVISVDFCHIQDKCKFGLKETGVIRDWNPTSGTFDIVNEEMTAEKWPNGVLTLYAVTDPKSQPKDYALMLAGTDTVSLATLKEKSGDCDRRLVQADCPTIALVATTGHYQSVEQLLKVADSKGVVARFYHRFFMSIKPNFKAPVFKTEGLKKLKPGDPDPF